MEQVTVTTETMGVLGLLLLFGGWVLRSFWVGRRVGAMEQEMRNLRDEVKRLTAEVGETHQRIDKLLLKLGAGP